MISECLHNRALTAAGRNFDAAQQHQPTLHPRGVLNSIVLVCSRAGLGARKNKEIRCCYKTSRGCRGSPMLL